MYFVVIEDKHNLTFTLHKINISCEKEWKRVFEIHNNNVAAAADDDDVITIGDQ